MIHPRSYSSVTALALLFGVVTLPACLPIAQLDSLPPACQQNLALSIEWVPGATPGSGAWEVRDIAATDQFTVCPRGTVTWSLNPGNAPGTAMHYFAWVQIDRIGFNLSGTAIRNYDAQTGFGVVTMNQSLTLPVRDLPSNSNPVTLHYGVLCTNPQSLINNSASLSTLRAALNSQAPRYDAMKSFAPLTFVQQASPPKIIIKR